MDSDTFNSVSMVIVGLATRLDNLCKLLINKGVISEDDIKQMNSDTAKEVKELYSED